MRVEIEKEKEERKLRDGAFVVRDAGGAINTALVVGVSSFIESCCQGVGSIGLMGGSDTVLLGRREKRQQNNLMMVQLQNISLIWAFFFRACALG